MKTIAILKDKVVVNLVIGVDAKSVPKPEDCTAVEVPEGVFIDFGLVYNPETNEFAQPQTEPATNPENGETV